MNQIELWRELRKNQKSAKTRIQCQKLNININRKDVNNQRRSQKQIKLKHLQIQITMKSKKLWKKTIN